MLRTGLRRGEIVNLKWSDIKYNPETNSYYIKILGKGKKERLIPINTRTIEELKYYAQLTQSDFTMNKSVFGMKEGNINRILNKYCENLNFKIAPHDTRRSYATRLHYANMPIKKIQTLLGHSSVVTTEIYIGKEEDIINENMDNYISW
jgi:integrase/recombinase XerD